MFVEIEDQITTNYNNYKKQIGEKKMQIAIYFIYFNLIAIQCMYTLFV